MPRRTKGHFLGLRTAMYHVRNVAKARDWYAKALGVQPYFDEPFYVGFNVGGFELGLHPGIPEPLKRNTGVITYWGVADARKSHRRLLRLGAKAHTSLQDVGGGIIVASVRDPFGNIFGIIENPFFKG